MFPVYLGIVNGMVSLCISKSTFFMRFRDYLFNHNYTFLHKLVSCPYCLSHWIAIILTITYSNRLNVHSNIILDIFCSIFVNVFLATITWTISFWLMNVSERDKYE